jgi:hypothetical protein
MPEIAVTEDRDEKRKLTFRTSIAFAVMASKYLPNSARRIADWTFPWICGGCTEPTYKDW